MCDIHHIARSVLHQIEEEHRIASYDQRHLHHMDYPLNLRCHPLQYVCNSFEVEGEGERELIVKVVVEMVGEVMVEMVRAVVVHLSRLCLLRYPPPPPHTYPSPEIFIPPHTDTSPSIPPHTYTSPFIPPDTYTFLPYSLSPEPASIAIDITFSSHPLPSSTLPPIGDTILDLVSESGPLPARRPRAPCIRQVLHPSAPLAPSTHQLPRLPRLHQLRLRLHEPLLPNRASS